MSAPDPGLNPEAGKQLNEYLLELRLPAIRRSFGDKARHAEAETLSYERYLVLSWTGRRMCWRSGIREAARRICCRHWGRN